MSILNKYSTKQIILYMNILNNILEDYTIKELNEVLKVVNSTCIKIEVSLKK